MRAEILIPPDMASRGRIMLEAMAFAAKDAGVSPVVRAKGCHNDCDILMVYGTGHPMRRHWFLERVRTGRPVVGWDLGYWERADESDATDFCMRMTLNGDHPPRYIREEPPERFDSQGIELHDHYNAHGPIVLIGMGRKAAELHAGRVLLWEAKMLQQIRIAYPKRRIVFRPKRAQGPLLPGIPAAKGGPIADVLRGASLVVCRHSNVAVDACIAGIPVVCEDGAAAALYGNDLRKPKHPSPEERLRFLRSLAYWNWKPSEAGQAWTYLLSRL